MPDERHPDDCHRIPQTPCPEHAAGAAAATVPAAALRPDRHRRQAQRGQVDAAQRAGRPEDQHHLAQGADHAPPHHRHAHAAARTQFVFVDTPGFQTLHANALNKSLNKTVQGAVGDVDLILFVVEAGSFTPADATRAASCSARTSRRVLLANKLDNVHRRGDIAPWLQTMQAQARLRRVRADVGQEREGHRAPVRHLREVPARAGLVVRRGRAHRPQREVPRQRDWCARSCSA